MISHDVGQVRLNLAGNIRLVHGVDVDAVHPVGDEVDDLVRGIGDSRLGHGQRIVAESVHNGLEAGGQVGSRKLADTLNLLAVGDRHNARHHGNGDSLLPNLVQKIVEDVVVEEHLGGEELATCVHLLLQIEDVLTGIGRLRMPLRVAGPADAEVPRPTDDFHQVAGIAELGGGPSGAFGNVAPQCQDIFYASRLDFFQLLLDGSATGGHAGKVGQSRHLKARLDVVGNGHRIGTGSAASAVGDAHKVGMQGSNVPHVLQQGLVGRIGLGRKDLEGQGGPPGF